VAVPVKSELIDGTQGGIEMNMKKCQECSAYTIKDICPKCGKGTAGVGPMRYSPQDRFGKYRLRAKQEAGILPK
jgi:H/ACA ribonucleoprotein complex subunit 3